MTIAPRVETPPEPVPHPGQTITAAPRPPEVDPPPKVVEIAGEQILVAVRTAAHPYDQAYCYLCKKWLPNDNFQIDPAQPGKPLRNCLIHGIDRKDIRSIKEQAAGLPPDPDGARATAEARVLEVEQIVGRFRNQVDEGGGGASAIDRAFAGLELDLVAALARRALNGDLSAMRLALERAERGRARVPLAPSGTPAEGGQPERQAPADVGQEDWQLLQRGEVGAAGPAAKPHDIA